MGAPKQPGEGHWELDLPPADSTPPAADEAGAAMPVERNVPPPPTPPPAVPPATTEPSVRVPDLSLGDEPSGEFAGLLFRGNVLQDDAAAAPPISPSAAAAPAEPAPAEAEELSWTVPAEPPPPEPRPRVLREAPALAAEPAPAAPAPVVAPPQTPAPTVAPVRTVPTPAPPAPPIPAEPFLAHATPAPPGPRAPLAPRTPLALPRPDPELRRRLEQAWARATSWPGMTEEQRRVALCRATLEVLGSANRVDSLADGLVHAIVNVQTRVGGTAPWLQEALVARLPREWLLSACALLARWSRLVAQHEGEAGGAWIEAAARLAEAVTVAHARALPEGAVELLRALQEEGNVLTRRMDPAVREWLRAGRYVRGGASEAQAATAALDAASNPIAYAAELESIERAVPLLVSGQRWDSVLPLVSSLARHATSDERFAGRARLAASVLDRIYVPGVVVPIVKALADGSGPAEVLVMLLRAGGPRVVPAGAEILERAKSAAVRRAVTGLLAEHPAHARAHALTMLADPALAPAGKRAAFELLGATGQPVDASVIAGDRDHPDEDVRCAVLWATTALLRERAVGLVLRAVDDPSRVVQARAVNLLGQLRSAERNVLDRLARILEEESPEEDAETVVTTALWALSSLGNLPLPGRGASVEKLLVTIAGRPRAAGLRRVLGGRSSDLWWQPPVRIALCRALAVLDTDRARAALLAIADAVDDPGRPEARTILARTSR